MGKFTVGSTVQQDPNQIEALQQRIQPDLPAGEAQPTPSPQQGEAPSGSLLSQIVNSPVPQDIPGAEVAPTSTETAQGAPVSNIGEESLGQIEADVERNVIPSISERVKNPKEPGWTIRSEASIPTVAAKLDGGGISERAAGLRDTFRNNGINVGMRLLGEAHVASQTGAPLVDIAAATSESQPGSFASAIYKTGAVISDPETGKPRPDDHFIFVASAAVENSLSDQAFGQDAEGVDESTPGLEQDKFSSTGKRVQGPEGAVFRPAERNAQLGQAINQEYQRQKGVKVPSKLPRQEAETLGNVMRTAWAIQNPDMVKSREIKKPGSQENFWQLSAQGASLFKKGEQHRKRMFPKFHVRPAKNPPPTGELLGDVGENVVRRTSGRLKEQKLDSKQRILDQAKKNLSSIPNVVNPQRGKILMQTLLPMLQSGDFLGWQGDISGMGESKAVDIQTQVDKQQARVNDKKFKDPSYDEVPINPQEQMGVIADDVANRLSAIILESDGANYVTYYDQAFNGRIAPQQTLFDPTSSKLVRFVTTNAVPVKVSRGSRTDKNLRQMYAMHLVKGGDAKLPPLRERALKACLLYTSPSPRDRQKSRMPSSA